MLGTVPSSPNRESCALPVGPKQNKAVFLQAPSKHDLSSIGDNGTVLMVTFPGVGFTGCSADYVACYWERQPRKSRTAFLAVAIGSDS